MKNKWILPAACVLAAAAAHIFLKRVVGRPLYDGVWRRDRPNGGLQKLLFDQYMNGRLFYSYSFGLGGECTVSSAIISLLLFYSCLSPPLSAFCSLFS